MLMFFLVPILIQIYWPFMDW